MYGNDGEKHTHHNHRFIQNILEKGEDTENFYRESDRHRVAHVAEINLTDECVNDVRQTITTYQKI